MRCRHSPKWKAWTLTITRSAYSSGISLVRCAARAIAILRQTQETLLKIPVPLEQGFPIQQAGIKPSRALSYELHTSASSDAIAQTVSLIFANTGSQAAVFHVYDKLHLERVPRRYVVEAGKHLDDVWVLDNSDAGHFDLWVLGPNGYHRAFAGELIQGNSATAPEIRVCYDITYGNVIVTLMNNSDRPCVFNVSAKAYRLLTELFPSVNNFLASSR
ncbi:phospholipase domain-containing protein [Serratia sp. UGAL515B_01]|uniref:phospholipase domain-containing protein n=1 Tax=Serratia sp. UGAL515B_01 TaxID=2986763 RepID=UPI0029540648|nr:phospholipase domain-containing protein [Serratia sp. UGAL515B_01]WON78896.1 DUF756 domain-containing protein [Serratia sp. UGAL515B_01]